MTAKRFVETVSTGIVTDTITKKEYRCEMRIDEDLLELLNELHEENQHLKQQRKDLLRIIDNNIEIYENINTNVEFHQGEIQGKLTLLKNLREVILND